MDKYALKTCMHLSPNKKALSRRLPSKALRSFAFFSYICSTVMGAVVVMAFEVQHGAIKQKNQFLLSDWSDSL